MNDVSCNFVLLPRNIIQSIGAAILSDSKIAHARAGFEEGEDLQTSRHARKLDDGLFQELLSCLWFN